MTVALIWILYILIAIVMGGAIYEKFELTDESFAVIAGMVWPLTLFIWVVVGVSKILIGMGLLLADFGRWIVRTGRF